MYYKKIVITEDILNLQQLDNIVGGVIVFLYPPGYEDEDVVIKPKKRNKLNFIMADGYIRDYWAQIYPTGEEELKVFEFDSVHMKFEEVKKGSYLELLGIEAAHNIIKYYDVCKDDKGIPDGMNAFGAKKNQKLTDEEKFICEKYSELKEIILKRLYPARLVNLRELDHDVASSIQKHNFVPWSNLPCNNR